MLFSSECRKGETNIVVRCPGGMAWHCGQRNSCHLMAMSCFMAWLFWNWLDFFMENEQSLSSIRHQRKPLFKLWKKRRPKHSRTEIWSKKVSEVFLFRAGCEFGFKIWLGPLNWVGVKIHSGVEIWNAAALKKSKIGAKVHRKTLRHKFDFKPFWTFWTLMPCV